MPNPPSPNLPDRAKQLLELGWTAQNIRRELHIGRRTLEHILGPASDPTEIPDDPFSLARRAARRCPGCGGLVFQWPCLTCELREREERETALRRAA